MSFELHWLVAEARSSCSTRKTRSPRPAASRAMPAPLIPPPMIRRSKAAFLRGFIYMFARLARKRAERASGYSRDWPERGPSALAVAPERPPHEPEGRLGIG